MHLNNTEAIFVAEWRSMLAARRRRIRFIAVVLLSAAAAFLGPIAADADATIPFLHAICLC